MPEKRPSPDELLARIKAEEQQKKRGKLTIFLGYAAGVGKTYAMLEAAQRRKNEVDLVVAYAETHGRAETDALLKGLEIIPRKQIEYHGIKLSEMDLDAVLARRPQLALVDELAHTNAHGSRHPKRYQDVEELLEAGIDVYTTLNIQHVESTRNTVAQITGVWVHETIPDTIVDMAAEIKLVDLPPDELLERLKQGKVYVPEQIAHAINDFFRKGNLIALREVAMRVAAEHVDKQVQVYMQTHAVRGPWPAAERLLVCIGPGPMGNRLVRNGRILASQLDAEWFAVYVETPGIIPLSSAQQDRLEATLRLAERLGAKVLKLQGQSVAATIAEYTNAHNITKVVVGKSQHSRWLQLLRGSVVDQLIRRSENVDVYIVGSKAEPMKQERMPTTQPSQWWWGYLKGLGVVIGATLIGELVKPFLAPTNLLMIYLLSVVVSAVYFGFGPSIFVSVLGVLAFDFFFVRPTLTFAVADMEYLFVFMALLVVGVLISYLTARVRRQIEIAKRRESETATLYALSRDMTTKSGLDAILNVIINHVKQTFGGNVAIFLPDTQNKENLKPYAQQPKFTITENDTAIAIWAFQHQQAAGYGTDTLPDAKARYLPLNATRGAVGVMGIWLVNNAEPLTSEQLRLLEAFADLAAIGIEHAQLTESIRDAQVRKQ
ncbi:MAG: sensor histidine kinase KdpD [Dehalococcoidia bacterium]